MCFQWSREVGGTPGFFGPIRSMKKTDMRIFYFRFLFSFQEFALYYR